MKGGRHSRRIPLAWLSRLTSAARPAKTGPVAAAIQTRNKPPATGHVHSRASPERAVRRRRSSLQALLLPINVSEAPRLLTEVFDFQLVLFVELHLAKRREGSRSFAVFVQIKHDDADLVIA